MLFGTGSTQLQHPHQSRSHASFSKAPSHFPPSSPLPQLYNHQGFPGLSLQPFPEQESLPGSFGQLCNLRILRDMTGDSKFSFDDLEDDEEETPDLVFVSDSLNEKFKDFTDIKIEDEIKKYEALIQNQSLKLKDGGGKCQQHLHSLQREKRVREKKQELVGTSAKQQVGGKDIDPSPGFGRLIIPGDGQRRGGTRSMSLNGLSRGSGTCSTVKTDSKKFNTPFRDSVGPAFREELALVRLDTGKKLASLQNLREPASPDTRTPSTETPFNKSRSSSGEQAGPSCREPVRPTRADQLGNCDGCQKSFSNLSSVQVGRIGSSLCSTCRRKAKTPDPTFSLENDYQTPVAKSVGRSGRRKRTREADVIGRTPDTAMEIDSSDEEDEKTTDCTGSIFKPSGPEPPRRIGLRSTFKRRMEGYKIAYPSRDDPEAVEILASDIQRLDPLEFLNDTVIDFYIKHIQRPEALTSEGKIRFHFFNSFFYKKLSEVVSAQKKKGGADFSKLRKWTKGTNIFEKDFLFVPIHDKLHWSLAIVSFPGFEPGKGSSSERCIIHLDSMSHGHNSQVVFRLLRSYLVAEWKHSVETGENEGDECIHTLQKLTAETIPVKKVPVPLQENESDCGLFLLHYIEKFVENAPKTMKLSDFDDLETLGVFGREWFLPTEASSLRTSIQEQLQRLFELEEKDQGMR